MISRIIRRAGAVLAAAAVVLTPLYGDKLDDFNVSVSQLERDLLTAAASKTGSYVQQEFEGQISRLNNAARALQFQVKRKKIAGEIDLIMPVMKLQDCYHKLKQGKERAIRNISFRRTSNSEFNRKNRRYLNDIRKSESTPEEKKRAVERLYDEWLGASKDYNLRRCGRIKNPLTRSYHEEYVVALCELRRLSRLLRRSGHTF